MQKNEEFFKNLKLLIISIDGKKEQHERFRRGTDLDQMTASLSLFMKKSKAKVLMWPTIREEMNLKDCVGEFLLLKEKFFCDYFFWHLIEAESPITNFPEFKKKYFSDLEFLFDLFETFLSKENFSPFFRSVNFLFLFEGHKKRPNRMWSRKIKKF